MRRRNNRRIFLTYIYESTFENKKEEYRAGCCDKHLLPWAKQTVREERGFEKVYCRDNCNAVMFMLVCLQGRRSFHDDFGRRHTSGVYLSFLL